MRTHQPNLFGASFFPDDENFVAIATEIAEPFQPLEEDDNEENRNAVIAAINDMKPEVTLPVEIEAQRVLLLTNGKGPSTLKVIAEEELSNEEYEAAFAQLGELAVALHIHAHHPRPRPRARQLDRGHGAAQRRARHDPVTLAEARSLTFAHRRKVFLVSTPTIRGLSRIEREFEASDQRRFFVPCPHCGHAQWLKFDRLRWQKGRPETAEYHCEGCERPIAEHHKTAMLEGGEWRATATAADQTTVGYHLSALYSPVGWLSWPRIARGWEAAQGSDEAIKAFRNTILGETWVESGEAPDWQRLYDRRESWKPGTVPAGGLFLTAGADVQKDRIEVDVWAWGRGLESWLVDHVVIEGGPDRHDAWSD